MNADTKPGINWPAILKALALIIFLGLVWGMISRLYSLSELQKLIGGVLLGILGGMFANAHWEFDRVPMTPWEIRQRDLRLKQLCDDYGIHRF